jgi:DNA-binding NarL/FixJ family response regulator
VRVLVLDDDSWREMGIARVLERAPGITPVLERDLLDQTWSKSLASVVLVSEVSIRDDARKSLHSIRRKFPKARILVHGDHADERDIAQLLADGADGYFSLSLGEEKLIKAIHVLESGSVWAPQNAIASVISRLRAPGTTVPPISSTELALLHMLDEGLSNKEMAARCGVAEVTIKSRLAKLYRRFDVRSRVQLLSIALRKGLLSRH